MRSLPLFHRIESQRVAVIGDGAMAAAKRRLVERAGGICCDEDGGARLAFVAVEDDATAEETAQRLKARGMLVNVADRPDLCDFTLPSVLERGDVLVAVGTGGASAGLAKHLRLRLEALLPSSLGAFAEALAGAKEAMRRRWPDAAERRRALDVALSQGGTLDPFDQAAPDRVQAWITGPGSAAPSRVVEISVTSDDPDELTLREARLLGQADTVLHDPKISPALLNRARADAVRGSLDGADQPRPGLTLVLRKGT